MAEPTASVALLIASWLTPSSLFIFVNLVIGTIAITSRFSNYPKTQIQEHDELQHHHHSPTLVHQYTYDDPPVLPEPDCTHPQLVRTPSFLERVRSFGLAHYYNYDSTASSEENSEFTQPQLVRTPSFLERVRSFNFNHHKNEKTTETSLLLAEEETDHEQDQSQAETNQPEFEEPGINHENPKEVPQLNRTPSTRKSASESGLNDKSNSGWEEDDWEVVERRRPATTIESWYADEEVDAKAEDFINRFKQQLRLQRVESILRYRQMLTTN